MRKQTLILVVFTSVAILGAGTLLAAARTRWDIRGAFISVDGGVSTGVGSDKIVWGDPATNSARFIGQHFYGDALPRTFSLLLTHENGVSLLTSEITGGRLKITAQSCIESPAEGCVQSAPPLELTRPFEVISTANTGNRETDPDAFVLGTTGLRGWVPENATATFRLVFQKRRPSVDRAPRAAALADADTLPYELVDVSIASGNGFVSVGTAPVPNRIDLAVQMKSDTQSAPIDPASDGVISAVVQASPEFSPSSLDVNSLTFGPGAATPVSTSWTDIDGDGDTDLVLQFRAEATGIACGETMLHLSGRTLDEKFASGWAAVKSVRCR